MIAGRFGTHGEPVCRARLVIPRLGIDREIDFLVDTGADYTCLHPADGIRIEFPFEELDTPSLFAGVGGSYPYHQEIAFVVLDDGAHKYAFDITLSIARPQPPTASNPRPVVNLLPSLLGRDVLNRLRIDYDHPGGRLRFFP